MKSQRAPFQPLSPDMDDKIENLAREKGVGALVKPAKSEQGSHTADTTPSEIGAAPPPSGATPRSRMKTVNLELPDYVWTDLKIRAAHKQTSVRHIVMSALRASGITIAEQDMIEDGRRLRGTTTL